MGIKSDLSWAGRKVKRMTTNGQRLGRGPVLDQSTRSGKLTGHFVAVSGLAGAHLLGLLRARTLSGTVFLRTGEALKQRGDARSLLRAIHFFDRARATFAQVMGLKYQWGDDGGLVGTSRNSSAAVDRSYEATALSEADARVRLARLGEDPIGNFRKAAELCDIISDWLAAGKPEQRNCLILEATARRGLADLNVDAEKNLQRAIVAWRSVGESVRETKLGGLEAAVYLKNMADACVRLADLGKEAIKNLEEAAEGYARAHEGLGPEHPDCNVCLMGEVRVRADLTKRGARPKENLLAALGVLGMVRERSGPGKPGYAEKLNVEASLRIELARLGLNAVENLQAAARLSGEARDCSAEGSVDFKAAVAHAATVRRQLALAGGKPEAPR